MGRRKMEKAVDQTKKIKHVRDINWNMIGLPTYNSGTLKGSRSQLYDIASNPKNAENVNYCAWVVSPQLAPYIIKSVAERKTYELLEYDKDLGRIPCGRTDFYAYRRKFYMLLLSLSA